jgi:hypothetical protein
MIVTVNYCPKCGNNTAKDGICGSRNCKYNAKHIQALNLVKERQL